MLVSKLENKSIDSRKLEKYGFVKSGNAFVYSVVICGGQMEVLVTIQDGKMYADVFDNETGEKYVLFYVESAGGAFVGRVRDEYEKVISRIFEQCFDSTVYRTGQTNAVLKYIEGKYGIRLENELICRKGEKNEYGQFMYFEPITFVPFDLDAIEASQLNETEKAWLNAYHKEVYEKIAPLLTAEEAEWLKEYTRSI